jgi:hypothetical protein
VWQRHIEDCATLQVAVLDTKRSRPLAEPRVKIDNYFKG